jgi:hypothetical protein
VHYLRANVACPDIGIFKVISTSSKTHFQEAPEELSLSQNFTTQSVRRGHGVEFN